VTSPFRLAAVLASAIVACLLTLAPLGATAQDASPDASLDPSAGIAATPAPSLAADQARVRMLNGSPDASPMDVYLDGSMVGGLSGMAFGAVSDYVVITSGSHDIVLFDSGADSSTDQPRYSGTFSFGGGSANTLATTDLLASLQLQTLVDAPAPTAKKAQVRFVQYSADLPAGDVGFINKDPLVTDLAYPNASAYVAMAPGSFVLESRPGGDASTAMQLPPVTVAKGMSYSVFIVGSAMGAEDAQGLTAVTVPDAAYQPPTTAMLRLVHASPDAASFDVYFDGARLEALTGISYGTVSGYLEVPGGSRTVTIFENGADPSTASPLVATDFTLEPGSTYTLAAANLASKLQLALIKDEPAPVADKAEVRYLDLSADAGSLDIAPDGKAASVSKLGFAKHTAYAAVDPSSPDLEVRQAGKKKVLLQLDPITLAAGTSSSVFIIGSASSASGARPLSVVVSVDAGAAP
jgi:hypothetical protein